MKNRVKFQCPICDEWHEVRQMKCSSTACCYKSNDDFSYSIFQLVKPTLKELLELLKELNVEIAYCDKLVWCERYKDGDSYFSKAVLNNEKLDYIIEISFGRYISYYIINTTVSRNLGSFKTLKEAKEFCQKHFDELKKGTKF